jgi:hypothetical protein
MISRSASDDPIDPAPAPAVQRRVVLHTQVPYERGYDELLQRLIEREIALLCVVGVDCDAWEDAMDQACVGPDGEGSRFVLTSSHPDETLAEVVAFAKTMRLDDAGGVEVIEVTRVAASGVGAAPLLSCRAPLLARPLWWPSSPNPFSRR